MRYRPKLRIEPTGLKRVLELVSLAGLIIMILVLVQNWGSLPDKIPSHFGFDGRPDAYAGKSSLLALAAIAIFIFLMLTIADRFPHLYNYFWKITPENAYRQYQLAQYLLIAVKAVVVWLFNYIMITQIRVSRGVSEGLSPFLLFILIGVILGTISIWLLYSYKAR